MMPPTPSDPKNITQEDVAKLTRAMKDDQFRGYLDEYVKEISDPAHRKEYLQYLAQLEAKDELPDGQALLRCEPGCCVKTTIRFKNGQVQKLFINICHSDRLDDLAMMEKGKDGGRQVNLPYSLSPPRTERDHKDDFCMTCDMAVSTGTFMQSVQNPQILKMLVDIAADGTSSKFLKGHEEVSKDYKTLKKVKCKGGEPMPMSVRSELLKGSKKPAKPVDTGGYDGVTPSELKQMRDDAKKKKEQKKQAKEQEEAEETEKSKPQKAKEEDAPTRIRVPKHRLVHSGTVDLADYMSNNPEGQTGPTTTVPKLLKLIVELPTVKKSSDISLEVTSYNVVVEVAGKYYLDLPLSYEIEDQNGTAKFDKAKQSLTLELPVVPKAPDPSMAASPGVLETGDEEHDGGLSEGHASDEEEALPPLEPAAPGEAPAAEEEQVPQPQDEVEETQVGEAAPLPTSPAKKNELLELSPDGGSLRIAEPAAEEARAESEPAPPAENSAETLADRPHFIAAASFEGAKPGYYFSNGEEGLGYYRDLRQPSRQVAKKQIRFAPDSDARPLVEEVRSSFTVVSEESPPRPPLPADLQRYLDMTSPLTVGVPASGCEAACEDLSLDWHQTRQNVVLSISIPEGHSFSDVQARFAGQLMVVTLFTRPAGDATKLWQRHCIRRKLCGLVDARQWHAEVSAGFIDVIVRKVDPVGIWTAIVDNSASVPTEVQDMDALTRFSDGSSRRDDASGCNDACTTQGLEPVPAAVSAGECEVARANASGAADADSAELDAVAPTTEGSANKDTAQTVVGSSAYQAKASAAMVQSATVMGHGVLLRNRLMYQLL